MNVKRPALGPRYAGEGVARPLEVCPCWNNLSICTPLLCGRNKRGSARESAQITVILWRISSEC
jgi:hypothetical protein